MFAVPDATGHMIHALRALPVLLLLLAMLMPVAGEDARAGDLIPRKILFGNPERGAPMISPDGRLVAFTAARDGVMNLWVAPVDDLEDAKPLTREKRRPIMEFRWASNSTHLLYFQDQEGDENFHVFSVEVSSGQIRDLTPFKGVRATIIGQSHRRPDEVVIGLNNRDSKWHDAWLVNVVSGASRLLLQNEGFGEFITDRDLNVRLGLKPMRDGGNRVFLRSGAKWRQLMTIKGDDAFNTTPLHFSEDGRSVFLMDSRGRDKSALTVLDLGTAKTTVLASSTRSDLAHVLADPKTGKPLAAAFEYAQLEWRAVDPSLKPDLEALGKQVPGFWFPLNQTEDNRRWVIWIDNPGKPIRFGLWNRDTRTLQDLYTARPALENAQLPLTSPHVIRSRDGLDLVSYLTLSANTSTTGRMRPMPMVLMVHGGPWARDSMAYNPYAAWLSDRGYAVLSVNFRGSTGFGKRFVNAGDREWGGRMHDDLIDAVDWAIARGVADPDRIAIYGASYGGYAALVGLTKTPTRFACAVDVVGPSNLVTLLRNIPTYWQAYLENFKRRVGDPSTAAGRKFLEQRSPLFHADRIRRSLLIGQGANDPRVTQREADQIVNKMQARGLPVTYVLYADEGHGFARPQNRLSFNAITEAFLARCLGGKAEPMGDDFEGSSVSVPAGKEYIPGLAKALEQN
jgi:dipeptidyl aminopeptidase/acylaminoacyl peptidase